MHAVSIASKKDNLGLGGGCQTLDFFRAGTNDDAAINQSDSGGHGLVLPYHCFHGCCRLHIGRVGLPEAGGG